MDAYRALSIEARKAVPPKSRPLWPPDEVVRWSPSCWSCYFRPPETRHRTAPVGARQTGTCPKTGWIVHLQQVCDHYQRDELILHASLTAMGRGLCEECRFQVLQGAERVCALHIPWNEQGDTCPHFEPSPASRLKHWHWLQKRKAAQGEETPRRPKVFFARDAYYRQFGRSARKPQWTRRPPPQPGSPDDPR